MSDYYPYQGQPVYEDPSAYAQKNNGLALTSMITGLSSWLLYIISLCLGPVLGPLTGGITAFCAIPLWGIGLIGWILAVIFGHVGLGQINNSGGAEGGRGMAITGLITGYLGLLFLCVITILVMITGGIGFLGLLVIGLSEQ